MPLGRGTIRKPFTYVCLAMCAVYGLAVVLLGPIIGVFVVIGRMSASFESGREQWTFYALAAYAALMVAGLPSCIALLRRYLSGGSAALREASRWLWLCAAGTLAATVLLLIQSLIQLYFPPAGRSAGSEEFLVSLFFYPLGIVFPYLASLRRASDRVRG
jgi:hypothetical protein